MIVDVVTKIFGSKHDRDIKKLQPVVDEINQLYADLKNLSDEALVAKTDEFKQRLENGETQDDILPEAFAVVKETCRRHVGQIWKVVGHDQTWDMIPYDVQLIGGIVLHQGKIAEMATGEGKTLVATLPTYLNALMGKGVHVVTVNDYLAQRDAEWMGQIYKFLGLSVGVILNDMSPEQRREAYNCDITYGTNNEFGFDYLRDNMSGSVEDIVQIRGHYYAIVDEVDNILIDKPGVASPTILAMSPATDQGFIDTQEPFTVQFSQSMDVASVEQHFQVMHGGRPVSGRYFTSGNELSASTFLPVAPSNRANKVR